MKLDKFNKRDTRFAPWTALCVLSLLAAMVFTVPSLVFAQTAEFSQDCETALVGTEHTIRVKVTGFPPPMYPGDRFEAFGFWIRGDGPNAGTSPAKLFKPDENGEFEFIYTSTGVGTDQLELVDGWFMDAKDENDQQFIAYTTWTDNKADLCSSSQKVLVGGRLTLNAKKHGALKIAVCGAEDLDVSNVDPKTVQLAGVAPWHWKQKDSRLCPDGKDGFKDLVLKFKNREVVKALEKDLGKEVVSGDDGVTLALTGELNDGTAFGGEWVAEFKKKGKRHGKNEQSQGHKNGKGKGPNK